MSEALVPTTPPLVSREELIAMVTRSHQDAAYGESQLAGTTLAAHSKLPRVIAENLGAGFGQWTFFPEPADVVDFACSYVPPATEEDVWLMARTWASDDAAGRHTLMALVGREVLLLELRRLEVPKLRELFGESHASRALALRKELGLDVPAPRTGASPAAARPAPVARTPRAAVASAPKPEGPQRMPKPAFVRPLKPAPEPPPRQFEHPKFGVGLLERLDGVGPDAKLTLKFACGSKTLLARFVTEIVAAS